MKIESVSKGRVVYNRRTKRYSRVARILGDGETVQLHTTSEAKELAPAWFLRPLSKTEAVGLEDDVTAANEEKARKIVERFLCVQGHSQHGKLIEQVSAILNGGGTE